MQTGCRELILLPLLLLASVAAAQVLKPPGQAETDQQTLTVSGNTLTFIDTLGTQTEQWELKPTGTPATLSVTISGCMRGGTCSQVGSSSATTASVLQTTGGPYDTYQVTGTWTGGSSPTLVVNRTATVARFTPPSLVLNSTATGATYTLLATDKFKTLPLTNQTVGSGGQVTVTVPQCGSGSFSAGFWVGIEDYAYGPVTLTTSTSVFNLPTGTSSSFVMGNGQSLFTICDGTNWNLLFAHDWRLTPEMFGPRTAASIQAAVNFAANSEWSPNASITRGKPVYLTPGDYTFATGTQVLLPRGTTIGETAGVVSLLGDGSTSVHLVPASSWQPPTAVQCASVTQLVQSGTKVTLTSSGSGNCNFTSATGVLTWTSAAAYFPTIILTGTGFYNGLHEVCSGTAGVPDSQCTGSDGPASSTAVFYLPTASGNNGYTAAQGGTGSPVTLSSSGNAPSITITAAHGDCLICWSTAASARIIGQQLRGIQINSAFGTYPYIPIFFEAAIPASLNSSGAINERMGALFLDDIEIDGSDKLNPAELYLQTDVVYSHISHVNCNPTSSSGQFDTVCILTDSSGVYAAGEQTGLYSTPVTGVDCSGTHGGFCSAFQGRCSDEVFNNISPGNGERGGYC